MIRPGDGDGDACTGCGTITHARHHCADEGHHYALIQWPEPVEANPETTT